MNDLLDILYYSGLNKFLYTNDNIINIHKDMKWSYLIALNLNIREINYIKDNFDEFIKILEKILYSFDQTTNYNFKNIAFNNVKIWDVMINNCVFLYNSQKDKVWYIKTNTCIEFPRYNVTRWITLYEKIWDLIEKKKMSVRNLIKLWISQSRARELYKFLKEKLVIIISENNHQHKTYFIEEYRKIWDDVINNIISESV